MDHWGVQIVQIFQTIGNILYLHLLALCTKDKRVITYQRALIEIGIHLQKGHHVSILHPRGD
jgi:hypothetical protein